MALWEEGSQPLHMGRHRPSISKHAMPRHAMSFTMFKYKIGACSVQSHYHMFKIKDDACK